MPWMTNTPTEFLAMFVLPHAPLDFKIGAPIMVSIQCVIAKAPKEALTLSKE